MKTRSPYEVYPFTIVHNNDGGWATFDYADRCDETEHLADTGSNKKERMSEKQRMFVELRKDGESMDTIADMLGVTRQTIYNWKNKFTD